MQLKEKNLTDLPPKVEEEVKSYVLKVEEYMFGLTPTDLRSLAYQVEVSAAQQARGKEIQNPTCVSSK
jgi:hypothetical protein